MNRKIESTLNNQNDQNITVKYKLSENMLIYIHYKDLLKIPNVCIKWYPIRENK